MRSIRPCGGEGDAYNLRIPGEDGLKESMKKDAPVKGRHQFKYSRLLSYYAGSQDLPVSQQPRQSISIGVSAISRPDFRSAT